MKDAFVGKSFRVMNKSVKHGFDVGTDLKVEDVYTYLKASDGSNLYSARCNGVFEDVSETFLKKACTQLKPKAKTRGEALLDFINTYGEITKEDIHFGVEGYYQLKDSKALQWVRDVEWSQPDLQGSLYVIKALSEVATFKVFPVYNDELNGYMTDVEFAVGNHRYTAYVKRESLNKYCEKLDEEVEF